jgi:signal transduction histidine kinase
MLLSAIGSTAAIRQIFLNRLEERVEKSLVQEVEEFRKLARGKNPNTGQPFGKDITAIFDVFLSRNVPNDDEFLITLLDGQFYKSSPRGLPSHLKPDAVLVKHWSQLTTPDRGEEMVPGGKVIYIVQPIEGAAETRGVFVVAHLTAGEREEVNQAAIVVIQVTLVVLALASMLAWIAAGQVLAPLRSLVKTARSISESDLTQRISIPGGGEVGEIATTFNDMMDRLQAAFTSQRDFLNDVGHELRTPITIIRGHLELLGSDPVEQEETLALVIDELDRMNRLVNDLLLLAKAERPDFLQLEMVEIGELTEELYAKAIALARRNWHLDSKARGWIVVDRQRITEAMMNLAQNATQHTQEGDLIAFGSAIVNGKARFWVRDLGEGIGPADRGRIFARFARGANSYRHERGIGLGLAIVQAIARAHGGQITLRSRIGTGSTFTIVLPLERSEEILSYESDSDC